MTTIILLTVLYYLSGAAYLGLYSKTYKQFRELLKDGDFYKFEKEFIQVGLVICWPIYFLMDFGREA